MSEKDNPSCAVLLSIPKALRGLDKDTEVLQPGGFALKQQITESHKNKTQANLHGSKHITHAHAFTHSDYKTTPES